MTRRSFMFLFAMLAVGGAGAEEGPRAGNLRELKAAGFSVSPYLPLRPAARLRPAAEIAGRLLGLHALVLWVGASPEDCSDEALRSYVKRSDLSRWLTLEERAILAKSRPAARAQHLDSIGWKLENLWALAWVLGFEPAPGVQGQLQGELVRELVYAWLPGPRGGVTEFLEAHRVRELAEVAAREDFLYCAHNAVRSAQLGGSTVPAGYDPISEGGCVHERRHSLTWCLSPGVEWEGTDLST